MTAPQQTVRRARRWICWLRRFAIAVVLLAVLVSAALFLLWRNLAGVAVWYANRTIPQLAVDMKDVGFTAGRRIEISHLSFKLRNGRGQVLDIEKATMDVSWRGLRAHKIDALNVHSATIRLTPALVDALSGNPSAAKANKTPAGKPSPAWVVGKLQISNGEFFMNGFGALTPEVSLKFNTDEQDVQFGADGDTLAEKPHAVQLWDVRIATSFSRLDPFLMIGAAEVDFTAGGLFSRRELQAVKVSGLDFQMGTKFRSFMAAVGQQDSGATPTSPTAYDANPWMIRELDVNNSRVTLADLGAEIPNISFNFKTALRDVALSKEIRHASTQMEQLVLSDLTIVSPFDPFVPVVSFKTILLRFSLAQILDQKIEEVMLDQPSIYIGEELFWYADVFKRRQDEAAASAAKAGIPNAPQADWRIYRFKISNGSLVLASATQKNNVALPLKFDSEAENLQFGNLADMQLKLNLKIPEGNYPFPAYQLEFKRLYGDIQFGLPPDSHAKNLVQTLHSGAAGWKQFAADKLWLSVTYDSKGIYGKFGGAAYEGYINGEFDFYLLPETPWTGWVSGTKVNLKSLTDILAPQNFQMSGPADFKVDVKGLNHQVERVVGNFKTQKSGSLKIAKLDDLIASLPPEWSSLKRGLTRIGLETLRDFDYTSANGDFWFLGQRGMLTLKMRGPAGSRNFDIALHGD